MKPLRSAGIVPCYSGKTTSRCWADKIASPDERHGHLAVLKILLRTQDRKVEAGQSIHFAPLTSGYCAGSVGIGKGVAEAISCRIRMTLDYRVPERNRDAASWPYRPP
jgi:hypothetical protein